MDLEVVALSEVSEIKTNIIRYHLCVESTKMMPMNSLMKQKKTHKHREQTYGYQQGTCREGQGKIGIWD